MKKGVELFNGEEREIINKITAFERVSKLEKEHLLKNVEFVISLKIGEYIQKLYEGLKEKLLNITDKEWNDMRELLPFFIEYSSEDVDPKEYE